jgi:hypothetical protein
LWMLVPALLALVWIATKKNTTSILGSLVLLTISISIKLASIAVVPIWLMLVIFPTIQDGLRKQAPLLQKSLAWTYQQWAWLSSITLFLPLFTERSKYFLPWYITWSLVWLPFMVISKNRSIAWLQKFWQIMIVSFSISSLYRYLPFLLAGNYDPQVVSQQIATTWVGGITLSIVLTLLTMLVSQKFTR